MPAVLAPDEVDRLLDHASAEPVRLLICLLADGLSLRQALELTDRDVHDGGVRVTAKDGSVERVSLSSRTMRVIADAAKQAGPLVRTRQGWAAAAPAARERILDVARAADVPLASIHQLAARQPRALI